MDAEAAAVQAAAHVDQVEPGQGVQRPHQEAPAQVAETDEGLQVGPALGKEGHEQQGVLLVGPQAHPRLAIDIEVEGLGPAPPGLVQILHGLGDGEQVQLTDHQTQGQRVAPHGSEKGSQFRVRGSGHLGQVVAAGLIAHQGQGVRLVQLWHVEMMHPGLAAQTLSGGEDKFARPGQPAEGGEQALHIHHGFQVVDHDQVGGLAQPLGQGLGGLGAGEEVMARDQLGGQGFDQRGGGQGRAGWVSWGSLGTEDGVGVKAALLGADPAKIYKVALLKLLLHQGVDQGGLADAADAIHQDQVALRVVDQGPQPGQGALHAEELLAGQEGQAALGRVRGQGPGLQLPLADQFGQPGDGLLLFAISGGHRPMVAIADLVDRLAFEVSTVQQVGQIWLLRFQLGQHVAHQCPRCLGIVKALLKPNALDQPEARPGQNGGGSTAVPLLQQGLDLIFELGKGEGIGR